MFQPLKRCELCGRVGKRGFRTIPAVREPYRLPAITQCAADRACYGRRKHPYRDDNHYG